MPGVTRVIIKQSVNAGVEIKLDKLMAWGNITGVNLDDLADMGVKLSKASQMSAEREPSWSDLGSRTTSMTPTNDQEMSPWNFRI
jgi:hypothetical protein